MKNNKWYKLYNDDILRNGGYSKYYFNKIKYRKKFINKIKKYALNKMVLEAGCGTGVIPINLAINGYKSYAVDCDKGMLLIVRDIALSVSDKEPTYLKADIFKLDKHFNSMEFDVIYSIGVYEHYCDDDIKRLLECQLKIAKYVFIGIPTKYFNDSEKLYGNERFLKIKYWRELILANNCKIVEEFSCYNDNFFRRLLKYKKWFRRAPIYVFVVSKL